MSMKSSVRLMLILAVSLLFMLPSAHGEDKFKLKPGAKGKICLTCHVAFQDKLKEPHVHTPVKAGDCSDCHNPHASDHGNLLEEDADKICAKCHGNMIAAGAVSSHKVVVDGNCTFCHDPHAAKYAANLVKNGNELCVSCHKDIGEKVAGDRFKHTPVRNDCLSCHNPHSSAKADSLLVSKVPSLCLNCHQADKPIFVKLHMNYPVKDARCDKCHDPHGSNKAAILYDNVHMPVENKMCNQCHNEPTSSEPLKLKAVGYEVCKSCHYDMVNDLFNKDRVHWPILDNRGCVNCHSPHAAKEKKLLIEPMVTLCGECHADTIQRQKESPTKHPPINEGNCTACHFVHGADNKFLFKAASVTNLCGTCHEWQKHSTHPIGTKYLDPRNPNLNVECLSCHRSHGTKNQHMFYFKEENDLCLQCHEKMKR
jgi:predicted CXXCH cytochrome family protein